MTRIRFSSLVDIYIVMMLNIEQQCIMEVTYGYSKYFMNNAVLSDGTLIESNVIEIK